MKWRKVDNLIKDWISGRRILEARRGKRKIAIRSLDGKIKDNEKVKEEIGRI